ncbi:DUF4011 domain-containing protein [Methylocella sp.]|uniref:DUF4011 domain-containing protein n=1 Tax=Methylocella sp. TaxID=1978226 RepID=UPI0035B3682D
MGAVTSFAAVRRAKSELQAMEARQPADPIEAHILKLLADARLKLIETSTRNHLVHTPRGGRRARRLPIVDAKSDLIFTTLAREGRPLRFLPAAAGESRRALRADAETRARGALRTQLSPDALHKRLHAISRDAGAAEEERGVNILFLALGFLRWYESDRSDAVREAPLILLPVALSRDARRSTFDLVRREEDIVANQALQERLRGDFGLSLPDIPENESWLPSGYFSAVAAAVCAKRRWSIDAEAVELGFYSSSKLLITRDLDPSSWPGDGLARHPLVRALLREGFASAPPSPREDARLDEAFDPRELVHVMDADASQTRVIESVRAGRDLVVQGPPGTGKSQTIANIVAAAVHDGKSVLFVAEKMAALSVVHDRLKSVGLDDLCLELHSRTANKRLVADRLDHTLQAAEIPLVDLGAADELKLARDALNDAAERLHAPIGETGLTPFLALSIQIAASVRRVTPDAALVEAARSWTRADYETKATSLERLAAQTAAAGPLIRHVYFGARRASLQPADFERLTPQMRRLAREAASLGAAASGLARFLGLRLRATLEGTRALIGLLRLAASLNQDCLPLARALARSKAIERVIAAADQGLAWDRLRRRHAHAFDPAVWTAPLSELRPALARAATFWPARLSRASRAGERLLRSLARAPLPRDGEARLALLDELIGAQALAQALDGQSPALRHILGRAWRGADTDFLRLRATAHVAQALLAQDEGLDFERLADLVAKGSARTLADDLAAGAASVAPAFEAVARALDLDLSAAFNERSIEAIDLERLSERVGQWAIHPARFEEWTRLSGADRRMRAADGADLADALATGALAPAHAVERLQAAFAEAAWRRAIEADPGLAAFDGARHEALADAFRALEARARLAAAQRVRAKHREGLPRGAFGAMATIRGEIGRKRNHMPLRKLMKTAGETIQKIKPVFLMSPLSVAQHLPPGALTFDLLIIDEASQVRPGDALGLVARCRQMVVVGDKKQLPPTQFFDRMLADEADGREDEEAADGEPRLAPVNDLESILTLCEARGVETRMLRWHYRSRHPSLIAVSNAEFYRRLIMPPAPTSERGERGLVLRRVAGAYDRGGSRTNLVEAEAVVAACAEHARATPALSLGVVTFSTPQRDLIAERLDARRRDDPALDAFLRADGREEMFVKNLENVQGDERDVVLISLAYGPREPGKPLERMAFGPISSEGGERRLNVAFTRARLRCEAFASFGSGDIDLERATGVGPRVLKRFLRFAETGALDEAAPSGAGFDSPFEANVAAAIEAMGYRVEPQIGSAGFRIDLAVRDPALPGRYILGVECDGATYHSALWARERDRLRQEVLEGLGWTILRVWSTDWFYRRDAQLRRLKSALDAARDKARAQAAAPASPTLAPGLAPPDRAEPAPKKTRPRAVRSRDLASPPPTEAARLAALIRAMVETDGPLSRGDIASRVGAGPELEAAYDLLAGRKGGLRLDGDVFAPRLRRAAGGRGGGSGA